MSPSEFDLRAALRDGEGDGVDVDRVVALGSARRAERRSRILTAAAAVVVVGALGTGGAFAFRGGGGDSGGSAAGKAASSFTAPKADSLGSSAAGGAAEPRVAAPLPVPCPVEYPRTLLPTGPATRTALFAEPVSSMVVCSYGSPRAATPPVRLALVGLRATDLADRLENASRTPRALPCPSVTDAQRTALVIIGVTAAGRPLPAVTTTVDGAACNLQATNGLAVRYDWKPPPELLQGLAELSANPTGPASLVPGPSGNQGSPVR
ncbi:MAG TPA: hypothetical protein VGN18_17645 [Jatrophihabitans sp.]|jgi:hypothetical protein|uniref:hypothetical protein n=1 Tax=Jatrophihabitans sp. TaxID=1932789 RepID=UPI002DFFF60A|nr:hypothetical protein [Jatrophihabitans sp.]